jgi:diguanylate cyclase (GGDEF)-like protein/PAS domain S-box-containing protein
MRATIRRVPPLKSIASPPLATLSEASATAQGTLPYAVLEGLAEGLVLVAQTGRISGWNRAMEEITGVSRDETLGRFVWDIYEDHALVDGVRAHNTEALVKTLVREALRDVTSPRLRGRSEFVWMRPDQEKRMFRADTFAVGHSTHCTIGYVVEDITDDRRAESALRLTQISVDRAADLIHWIASDGRLLYVSESTCTRHGYSREELLGMTIFDLDPLLTPRNWDELWQELRDRSWLSFDTIHNTRSGEAFPIEVMCNYVFHDGCEYNFVYGRDITERKLAEEELQRAKKSLESSNRELKAAMRSAKRAAERLQETNEKLLEIQNALALQARTDPLTATLNRGAVLERLAEALAFSDRSGSGLGVGMIDVDFFKKINDTYGHPAGDEVLREMVRRVQSTLRPYDVLGRFGGEEFLVILPQADGDQTRQVLERIRGVVASHPVLIQGKPVPVTVSIGGLVRKDESLETLIREVDVFLYRAKERGRNRLEMVA